MRASDKNQRAYDRWAETYDHDRPPHTYLEEPFLLEALQIVESDLVLDVACGTGRYAMFIRQRGAEVTGCDLSRRMLDQAEAKLPEVSFVQTDLNHPLPFKSDSYTKIVCSLAVKHLENIEGFFVEIFRILQPGGKLVFSTTHPEMNWATYERRNPPAVELHEEGLIFSYKQEDFQSALESCGFENIHFMDILADDSMRAFLTDGSFQMQVGKKFVLIISACRPKSY